MTLIDDFIAHYRREYDYYREAARLCAGLCERRLKESGIRAIVTHRAKNPDSLKEKLLRRSSLEASTPKHYTSFDDIYADIYDFAGARVGLYFPADIARVGKLIEGNFALDRSPKLFPVELHGQDSGGQIQAHRGTRFSGYTAHHYLVRLRPDTAVEGRYTETLIEIQVASVLMHAWAEVEHDLVYKPLHGRLSEEEHAILDQVNGLVLSGEIALELLQQAMSTRVGKSEEQFYDPYELAAYLLNVSGSAFFEGPGALGRIDLLLRFLQLTGLNRRQALEKFVTDLDSHTRRSSIGEQVLERILRHDRTLTRRFVQALLESEPAPWTSAPEEEPGHDLLEEADTAFLTAFYTFDTAIRAASRLTRPDLPAGTIATYDLAKELLPLTEEQRGEWVTLLMVRNWLFRNEYRLPVAAMMNLSKRLDFYLELLRSQLSEEALRIVDEALRSTA